MENASDRKKEMETTKKKTEETRVQLKEREVTINAQLEEVTPLIESAKAAVGNIKAEHLGEIRALRAPPPTVRIILEAVLALMGIADTSWNSMKVCERWHVVVVVVVVVFVVVVFAV